MHHHDNGAFPISYVRTIPHLFLLSDLKDVSFQLSSRAHSEGFSVLELSVRWYTVVYRSVHLVTGHRKDFVSENHKKYIKKPTHF
jgi:hypothetical protein